MLAHCALNVCLTVLCKADCPVGALLHYLLRSFESNLAYKACVQRQVTLTCITGCIRCPVAVLCIQSSARQVDTIQQHAPCRHSTAGLLSSRTHARAALAHTGCALYTVQPCSGAAAGDMCADTLSQHITTHTAQGSEAAVLITPQA
jgi:hypothetical protein